MFGKDLYDVLLLKVENTLKGTTWICVPTFGFRNRCGIGYDSQSAENLEYFDVNSALYDR